MGTRIVMNPRGMAQINRAIERMQGRLVKDIENDARDNAPVDTGELAASIFSEAHGTTGRVGATADHAEYVELGTRHMQAQPYLRPALYKKRQVSS